MDVGLWVTELLLFFCLPELYIDERLELLKWLFFPKENLLFDNLSNGFSLIRPDLSSKLFSLFSMALE